MADLGSIYAYPMATYNHPTHTVSGTVLEVGTPVAKRLIRMHSRSTGDLINQNYSFSDGTFSMSTKRTLEGLETYLVAFDDDSGTSYNAMIYDRIIPA